MALTADGHLYGWGTYRDSSGVFGFSPKDRIALLPTLVYSPTSQNARVVKIASGGPSLPASFSMLGFVAPKWILSERNKPINAINAISVRLILHADPSFGPFFVAPDQVGSIVNGRQRR